MFKSLLATIITVCISAPAFAKTLYVNSQTGDDSVSYESNSETSPWRTIGRAATGSTNRAAPNTSQAARAGDTVLIAPGIYWESGYSNGGRFTVSLNPINSGTQQNPIIFRGNGTVYVRMLAGFRGGMIGCNGRNYIIWDNFHIDDYYGGSTSDTGPVVFSGNAQHCQIINSDIKGHPGSYYHGYPTYGGNYRGISIEPANNIVVRNNRVYQFRGGQNEAGLMTYDSNDNIIENNEFFDNGAAVFIKGVHPGFTQARNIIRKNVVRDNWSGIRVLGSTDALIYQNVIMNNRHAGLWAGFTDSRRSKFFNNTLFNNEIGFVPQGADLVDVELRNNIFANNRNAIYNWDVGNPSGQDVAYSNNIYNGNSTHANYESGGTISYSSWQSTYRLDLNSSTADPAFENAAGGDFRLRTTSAARNLGVDYLDLNLNGQTTDTIPAGAYVTGTEVIGRLSSSSAPAVAPSAPTDITTEVR